MRQPAPGLIAFALAVALATACAPRTPEAVPQAPAPPTRTDWQATRETVQSLALDARYREADSVLRAFERRSSDTAAAQRGALAESRFYRMLLKVDPSNPASSPDSAIRAIDEYLAAGSGQARYQEALVLRRLTGEIQALRNTPSPVPIVFGDTALLRQRTEEVERLRDSLTRTIAELDRIRRRLRSTRPDEIPPP